MANFGEVVRVCSDLTARPDKATAIKYFINSAIYDIACRAEYPQALSEVVISVSPEADLVTEDLPANFIKVAYVIPSPDVGCHLSYVIPRAPNASDYGYYVAGNQLHVRTPINISELAVGWYVAPADLVQPEDTNWILDRMHTQIVNMTITRLRAALGDSKAANQLITFTAEWLDSQIRQAMHPYTE